MTLYCWILLCFRNILERIVKISVKVDVVCDPCFYNLGESIYIIKARYFDSDSDNVKYNNYPALQ